MGESYINDVSVGSTEPLTVSVNVKPHLGFASGFTDDDTYLGNRLIANREWVEQRLGISMVLRTVDYFQDRFYGQDIILPWYPLVSVTGVFSSDIDNDETEFDSSNYSIDTDRKPGRVILNDSAAWPSNLRSKKAVRVRYVAGYANTTTDFPLKKYSDFILKKISLDFFEDRSGSSTESNTKLKGLERSIASERINWI